MRNIQDLTSDERERILQDADRKCYSDIADDLDTTVYTVKRVIRKHNRKKLKRYDFTAK